MVVEYSCLYRHLRIGDIDFLSWLLEFFYCFSSCFVTAKLSNVSWRICCWSQVQLVAKRIPFGFDVMHLPPCLFLFSILILIDLLYIDIHTYLPLYCYFSVFVSVSLSFHWFHFYPIFLFSLHMNMDKIMGLASFLAQIFLC